MESTGQYILWENHTTVMEFILLGFSAFPKLQGFLCGVVLIIYTTVLMGNSLIIIITKVDASLQTPMYFFLGNYSFLEICYVSVTAPRLLTDLLQLNRSISFTACAIQMYFFLVFGATECFILTAMAYDRYAAICNPLLYHLIMNNRLCVRLATLCWFSSIPIHIGFVYRIFSLTFCSSNQINHYFCDIPAVMKLACGDILMTKTLLYVLTLVVIVTPFILILGSYVKIISTILKLPSATGRAKAFSTCSSHLTVVILFFGSGSIVYLKPISSPSTGIEKIFSLIYTIVIPMFNPMIYCLRNKDAMAALKKLLLKCNDSKT
ncbi:olfactory receptor 10AG1-like [Suncus etruscus]|uniref:olfactory receptor 10AG1-like n=1 Tax=Suncus etruscus TaxID=109475 RepID=UPI0021108EB6|nr:olfactory receptor 10AG1-like [Suncus etruscus]